VTAAAIGITDSYWCIPPVYWTIHNFSDKSKKSEWNTSRIHFITKKGVQQVKMRKQINSYRSQAEKISKHKKYTAGIQQ